MARGLDSATGPLARVVYLRPEAGSGPAEIVLAFHHAVVDAASGLHWAGELLGQCADAGPPPEAADGVLPPPTDACLPAAFRGGRSIARKALYVARELGAEVAYRARSRGVPSPRVPAMGTCRVQPVTLEPDATAALVAEAHRRRITINSALNAALGLAVWRHRYGSRPMTLRALAFADLRPYLSPPLPPDVLACHIAMLLHAMDLRPGKEFWDVARAFQERLYRSARRGEKFLANSLTKHVMGAVVRARSFRMSHTAVSYAGALRLEPAYGPFRVRGLHAFVCEIPVGPEFTALARLDGERLQLDFVHLAEDMDRSGAATLAADVVESLVRAGGGRP